MSEYSKVEKLKEIIGIYKLFLGILIPSIFSLIGYMFLFFEKLSIFKLFIIFYVTFVLAIVSIMLFLLMIKELKRFNNE